MTNELNNQPARSGNMVDSQAQTLNIVDILVSISGATPITYNGETAQNILNRSTPISGNMVASDGKVYNVVDVLMGIGEVINYKKLIVKTRSIPEASEDTYRRVYLYVGKTDENYTHGYFYECQKTAIYSDAVIGFDPHTIGFDYDNYNLISFFSEITSDYGDVVNGTATYDKVNELWTWTGKDSDGNTVFDNIKYYTQDLIDAGFVFINPEEDYEDGEVFTYTINYTEEANYSWVQLEVPSMPTTDGTYVLTCTVDDGEATLSWESTT